MSDLTSPSAHPPVAVEGGPTWMDLSTPDVDGAIAFYSTLFGWEFTDTGADFHHYRMISVSGRTIGGAMSSLMGPQGPTDEAQSPTAWTIYLRTADIDAAFARAGRAGGQGIVPPMQVGESGRMAVVLDPAGAAVGMWQPVQFEGIEDIGSPGTPCWFEELTTDFDAAEPFYREVFSWDVTPMPGSGEDGFRYVTHGSGNRTAAGLCDARAWLPEGSPSFWRMYVVVDDTDAAAQKVRELGGAVLDGPQDSPFGRLATVTDPQGASFQIIVPRPAD